MRCLCLTSHHKGERLTMSNLPAHTQDTLHALLASHLPMLNSECVSGTAPCAWYLELAAAYVDEVFPDAPLCCIHGSVAAGTPGPFSDLDLYVVETTKRVAQTRREVFRGMLVECVHIDIQTLEAIFSRTLQDRRQIPFPAKALVSARLLRGDGVLLQDLQRQAREVLALGPQKPDAAALAALRNNVANRLMDLVGREDPVRRLVALTSLFEVCLYLSSLEAGDWHIPGNWNIAAIAVHNPTRARILREIAADLMAGGAAATALVALVLELLAPYGGLLVDGHSRALTGPQRF
jgi:hypothetical protein